MVQGSYSYTSPDGTPITVTYIADENGKLNNMLKMQIYYNTTDINMYCIMQKKW